MPRLFPHPTPHTCLPAVAPSLARFLQCGMAAFPVQPPAVPTLLELYATHGGPLGPGSVTYHDVTMQGMLALSGLDPQRFVGANGQPWGAYAMAHLTLEISQRAMAYARTVR